jgi:3-phytase/alkaline phosphatase D
MALVALSACAAPAPPPAAAPRPDESAASAPPTTDAAPAPSRVAAEAAGTPATVEPAPVEPGRVELLATWELATGHRASGTEVGGLSALAYDPAGGVFYALSDDRGDHPERGPPRLYALRPLAADGSPVGGFEVAAVTALRRGDGPLPAGGVDPEGLALAADGFWIASEGVPARGEPPFVRRFGRDGVERAALPVPTRFVPDFAARERRRGVRDNLGFEALAITPDGRWLIAGTESALLQDGPVADHEDPALVRLVVWDLATGEAAAEHAYPVEPLPWPPAVPGAFRVSGLVDLTALDRLRLVTLERAFAADRGTALRLYRVDLAAAGDVSGVESLTAAGETLGAAAKELLFDLGAALAARGVAPDNLEGMAFGPDLPDGRRLLVLVADNNFNPAQRTLFVALAVPKEALGATAPAAAGTKRRRVPP